MSSVREHYDNHLGPVYAWMVGGETSALARGDAEIGALDVAPRGGGIAVDLGAGFGMHAIALAERGFDVVAVDACSVLLDRLERLGQGRRIRIVRDDMQSFVDHLPGAPELVMCLGDTLTHLPDDSDVEALIEEIAGVMEPGGRFIATFRDYSQRLDGTRRFIPVRSDMDRNMTCFLEYSESHVLVHDILSERRGAEWATRVGAYRKLRLAPARFRSMLIARGFSVEQSSEPAGMVRFSSRLDHPGNPEESRTRDGPAAGIRCRFGSGIAFTRREAHPGIPGQEVLNEA